MSDNRLLFEPDVERDIFRISENFAVSEADAVRDAAAADRARELLDRYLVIDGMAWVRDEELVYYARPPSASSKGSVMVTSSRLFDLSIHHRDKYWLGMWAEPNAMVFSASSADAVAEFSGHDIGSFAAISVYDDAFVSHDLDAVELERCARIVDRHSELLGKHGSIADILPVLRSTLATPPSPERLDNICDLLSGISAGLKAEGGRSRAAIGRHHINGFVERYTGRPVAAVDIPLFPPAAPRTPHWPHCLSLSAWISSSHLEDTSHALLRKHR
jgi:hypothetical protein